MRISFPFLSFLFLLFFFLFFFWWKKMSDDEVEHYPTTHPWTEGTATTRSDINVVVVGNLGVGKTCLANYLFNLGDRHNPLFKVERKEITTKSFLIKYGNETVKVNLMDTPGLSQVCPEQDFHNMIGLFEEMQKMDKINVIILVLSLNSRFDHQTLHTLKYYHALLQPVFWHGSVFLGVPNFNQRRLDEILEDVEDFDEVDDILAKKLACWRKECEEILQGTRIAAAGFFESLTTKLSRKREIAFFEAGERSFTSDGYSLLARNLFLMKMLKSRPTRLAGHTFTFPPAIETRRREKLEEIQMLLAQLKEKAALQLKVHGHKLDNLEVASKEIVKKLTEVGVLEDQISELSQRGNSGCVYVDGNNRVGLGEADVYPVWAEVKNSQIEYEAWNCECEEVEREEIDGKYLIFVKITPKSLNFFINEKDDGTTWSCKVWTSWDGRAANFAEIERKNDMIENLKRRASEEQRCLERDQFELFGVSKVAETFQARQQELQSQLLLASKTKFTIKDAFHAMSIFTTSSPQVLLSAPPSSSLSPSPPPPMQSYDSYGKMERVVGGNEELLGISSLPPTPSPPLDCPPRGSDRSPSPLPTGTLTTSPTPTPTPTPSLSPTPLSTSPGSGLGGPDSSSPTPTVSPTSPTTPPTTPSTPPSTPPLSTSPTVKNSHQYQSLTAYSSSYPDLVPSSPSTQAQSSTSQNPFDFPSPSSPTPSSPPNSSSSNPFTEPSQNPFDSPSPSPTPSSSSSPTPSSSPSPAPSLSSPSRSTKMWTRRTLKA